MQSEITERAKTAWNSIADEFNQWDALGLDEQETYVALTAALVDVPAVEPAIPTANCCVCGRIIDTREKSEGGDDFGDETEAGKWTCSVQCYDSYVGFVPDVPAPHREGEDSAEVIEKEIASVVQSVNEWDDRTSPDDYPEHLLITSDELADILRNFSAALAATRSASATTASGGDHGR